jgi:hypothetical protein
MPATTKKKQETQEAVRFEEKENWASFENNREDGIFEQSFESTINWNGSPETFTATEAAWIDQLIPNSISHSHNHNHNNNVAPPISANRRDCGYGRYHDLYQGGAAEHLSNEEWIVRRRRREQVLRRHHRQQQRELEQQQLHARAVVFRHEPPREEENHNSHHHHRLPFVLLRTMPPQQADGDPLLASLPPPSSQQQPEERVWRRRRQRQRRHRARQLHATALARRERLGHWSSSLVSTSVRLLTLPLRILPRPVDRNWRSDARRRSQETTSEAQEETGGAPFETRMAQFGLDSLFDDSSSSSSSSRSDSDGEWGVSGPGWRWGQQYEDDSSSFGSTAYWSTGTAVETLSDSSASRSGGSSSRSSSSSSVTNEHVKLEEDVLNDLNDLGFSRDPVFSFDDNDGLLDPAANDITTFPYASPLVNF